MSEGSDFDIFFVPSRRDMTRVADALDHRLGQREEVGAEVVVELRGDVAGQLEMLLLVLAHRHVGRLVEQDVGGLQRRVGERPSEEFSAFLPALSLNWVIRSSQPSRATQLKIQASSAWPGTWLWLKRIERAGSRPQARKAAAISRVALLQRFGSCQTVIACRSTTQ